MIVGVTTVPSFLFYFCFNLFLLLLWRKLGVYICGFAYNAFAFVRRFFCSISFFINCN